MKSTDALLWNWKSVKTALPKINDWNWGSLSDDVVVCIRDDNGNRHRAIDRYDTISKSWYVYSEENGFNLTHWIELPEAPELPELPE